MPTISLPLVRLSNQQLDNPLFENPRDLVSYMGALQAQDYHMVKWAVGLRIPGSSDADVQQALDAGEILRTHLLRPTWHLVSASDIYWMLDLTAPQILTSMRSRQKQLELDEKLIKKSNKIIEKALASGDHLTRNELAMELEKEKIATKGDNRLAHILLAAEMNQIICSGITRGKEQTYALLANRVPVKRQLKKDEALAELANRYFTSHGPATLEDFIWWSGLKITDAKTALEMIKPAFIGETIGNQTYWLKEIKLAKSKSSVHFLPAFDEYVISYKDRTAVIAKDVSSRTISTNGVFWPVIVVDGQVVGTWKRIIKKETVLIEPEWFSAPNAAILKKLTKASQAYGDFLKKKVCLILPS